MMKLLEKFRNHCLFCNSNMAARSHVHGNSVAERRLRPIYDWLDSGHNKKALQEADKVLRKTSNLQCARALKALSLLRLGREAESIALLDVLAAERPSDESTLQAMTACYRELQQYQKVCSIYEAAVKEDPTNEELHSHVFMAYVRTLDFKQQQQAAMVLYKLTQKNPYYFWAIMSVVLQATRDPNNDEKKAGVLLSLAERMVVKLLNENRIDSEPELQLYIIVLKLLKKDNEVLALLDGPLGNRLIANSATSARIPFLLNLKRWREINQLCAKLLTENHDLWDVWKYYLQSVFEIMAEKDSGKQEDNIGDAVNIDDTPEKCHDFICNLMESNSSVGGVKVRGPSLARLELYVMMQVRGYDPKALLGDFLELLVEYFRKFGDKPSCVYDLRLYIKHLPDERRSDLSAKLLKEVGINAVTLPQDLNQMLRHISSLQISRLCGAHENLNKAHLVAFVTALALHYQHGTNSYAEDLLATDCGPADPYAILSAHVLFDISIREKSSSPLVLAITLLENLLKTSPTNHHAKLLCVRLYHYLGAGHAAHQMYESLDIKHIQLDSIGYLHAAQLPVVGPIQIHHQLCNATCTFFTVNYRDTADHLTFSYKFGSFIKLEELLDFRERLNNSLHKFMVFTEKKYLDLVNAQCLQSISHLNFDFTNDVSDYDKIRDNRDLNAIVSYDPITLSDELEKENQAILEQEKDVVKLRTAMFYYILAAIKLGMEKGEDRKEATELLLKYKNNYETVYTNIENSNQKPIAMTRLSGHFPTRLHCQLAVPYKDVLNAFIELISHLSSLFNEITPEIVESIISQAQKAEQRVKVMTEDICKFVTDHANSEDYNLHKRRIVESVINVVELISIVSLLVATCCELGKHGQSKKARKKNAANVPTAAVSTQLKILTTSVKSYIETLDKTLNGWWSASNETTAILTDRLNAIYLSDGSEQVIFSKLEASHNLLVKDIHNVLKDKVKMLNTYL